MALPTLLLFAACSPDQGIARLYPKLAWSPEAVDFGEVVVDYTATSTVELINAGRVAADVAEVGFADGGLGVFDVQPASFQIPPDGRQELTVSFLPPTYLDYADTITLASADFDPEAEPPAIPVSGFGGDGPTPDIEVDPLTVDFGTVPSGSTGTSWFEIRNTGDGDLHILATSQEGAGTFQVVSDPRGFTLAPGGEDVATVVVVYNPSSETGDWGTFHIESDDPDEPEVQVHLKGNGGGDYAYPVAVIDAPASAAPLDTLPLDGSGSYDPQGGRIVTWDWTLSSIPSGSRTELVETGADSAQVFLDIAGTYQVQLQVWNDSGVPSAPASYTVDAVPKDRVHVELLWDTGNSDLDLHLLQGSSAELFDKPDGDCCYCNQDPNWADGSTDSDDPRLDLDDISGYGPENINIDQPADGRYPVRVHYFEDNGGGATTATVRFYVDGSLEAEYSRLLTRNQLWEVGTIKWPDGVVIEEDSDPVDWDGPRDCY